MSSSTESFPLAIFEQRGLTNSKLDSGPGLQVRYQVIASDKKFRHFVRIPDRIGRCLDRFGISFERDEVLERLRLFYLFIAVVDDAIDSGPIEIGKDVIAQLDGRTFISGRHTDVSAMTELLRPHVNGDPLFLDKLSQLYRAAISERAAGTMTEYIGERENVGRLTAELSYLLVRSSLKDTNRDFAKFMQAVGAAGCLVDSLIDLSSDRRFGLLGFTPRLIDYAKLARVTLGYGLRLAFRHPRVADLFFQAVIDNILDRIIRNPGLRMRNQTGGSDYRCRQKS
jgi:hypothetical protein